MISQLFNLISENMKNAVFSIITIAAICFGNLPFYVQAEEVSIESDVTVGEPTHPLKVTGGKWTIKLNRNQWKKTVDAGRFVLYPNAEDKTKAVLDAEAGFKAELARYIKLALEGGFYVNANGGYEIVLQAPFDLNYHALNFCTKMPCSINTRIENREYAIKLFPNQSDETDAARVAREAMVAHLAVIETAAQDGNFFK